MPLPRPDIGRTGTPVLPFRGVAPAAVVGLLLGALQAGWMWQRSLDPLLIALNWLAITALVVMAQEGPQLLLGRGRLDTVPLRRTALALTLFAVDLGLLGIGYLVPVAGVVVGAVHISRSGSSVARPTVGITLVATLAVQLLWTLGLTPGTVAAGDSWIITGLAMLMSGIGITNLGLATAHVERANRELARAEHRFRALVHNLADAMVVVDAAGRFTYTSPVARDLLKLPAGDRHTSTLTDLLADEHAAVTGDHLARLAADDDLGPGATARWEVRGRTELGLPSWVEISAVALRDDGVDGVLLTLRDVTERRERHDALTLSATRDPLTGLLSRQAFLDQVSAGLEAQDEGPAGALMFCDLDGFKAVNDDLGHAAGDEVLQVVGARLIAGVRATDLVCRIGGDEFAVHLGEPVDDIGSQQLVDRLRSAVTAPMTLTDGRSASVGVSIGLVPLQRPVPDLKAVLAEADAAMYRNKQGARRRRAG